MKIDVYSNIYNEEFMLPYWLRHYETIADRIFVWDGGSTDGTLDILKKHHKVTLLPRDQRGHDDHYYVTELYPQYKEHSCGVSDLVIIADADEFVYHPNLKETLSRLVKDGVEIIQCDGYSMMSNNLPTTNGQIYDSLKVGIESNMGTKWTIHSPNVDVRYRKGRHGTPYNFRGNYKNSRHKYHGIKLLHYRYIGKEYIEERERKNIEQMEVAFPEHDWSYTTDGPRTMPDGEQINIFEWMKKNKEKFINVLEA